MRTILRGLKVGTCSTVLSDMIGFRKTGVIGAAMKRLVLVPAFASVLGLTAVWTGRAQQQPAGATAPRFTGTSTAMEGKDLTIARRRFEPGARTYWHSHDRGQLLLVEQGRMRVQSAATGCVSSASAGAITRRPTSFTGTVQRRISRSFRSTPSSAAARNGLKRSPLTSTPARNPEAGHCGRDTRSWTSCLQGRKAAAQ